MKPIKNSKQGGVLKRNSSGGLGTCCFCGGEMRGTIYMHNKCWSQATIEEKNTARYWRGLLMGKLDGEVLVDAFLTELR